MPKKTGVEAVDIAVMARDIEYIKKEVDGVSKKVTDLDDKVSKNYVSQEEFKPIKMLVYGLVGIILVAVIGALLKLVILA